MRVLEFLQGLGGIQDGLAFLALAHLLLEVPCLVQWLQSDFLSAGRVIHPQLPELCCALLSPSTHGSPLFLPDS